MTTPAAGASEAAESHPESPQVRPFAAVLQEHRNGGLHSELSERLAEVVSAVRQLGKPGAVTVTLTLKPADGQGNAVVVTDEIKTKVPQPERPSGLFFADDHGNLSRRDPRQPELPLRQVRGGDGAAGAKGA
jgi:hypothetical protein